VINKNFINNKGLKFTIVREQNSNIKRRGKWYLCRFENGYEIEARIDCILKGSVTNRYYPYSIGQEVETSHSGILKITKETKIKKCGVWFEVEFLKTGYKTISRKDNLRNCYDKLLPRVSNVGYIGDVDTSKYKREYSVWHHMLDRCYNKNNIRYNSYGSKGIKVDDRWHCFKNFLEDIIYLEGWDVNKFYSGKLEIDKDKKQFNKKQKLYSKNTCVWISQKENSFLKNKCMFVAISPKGDITISDDKDYFVNEYNLIKNKITACIRGASTIHRGWHFFKYKNYTLTLPNDVNFIFNIFKQHNKDCFLVGGSLRTILDNKFNKNNFIVKDYDFSTNSSVEDIKNIFSNYKKILTGEKYGTVTVVINSINYEITCFRNDLNGRKPKVFFNKNIKEDAKRRDFTINAIYYNHDYGLIDYFKGVNDIKNKTINTPMSCRNTFSDDPLRMLRAIRFSSQLNYNINIVLINEIKRSKYLIKTISQERIRDELCKILMFDCPSRGIKLLEETGLLYYIIPELTRCVNFDQRNIHHNKNVFDHIMAVLDNTPKDLIIRLSALLHDIAKPIVFTVDENNNGHFYKHHLEGEILTEKILKRLKFDNKTIETVKLLVRHHMDRYDFLRSNNIKKFINRVGVENLDSLFELQIADIKGSSPPFDFSGIEKLKENIQVILNEKQPLMIKDLKINGYDLMELGFKPGKQMGDILDDLLETILENPSLNEKDNLISIVKEKWLGDN